MQIRSSFVLRALAAFALTTAAIGQADQGPLQPGALAPDFVSVDASCEEVRLSDYAGMVVVLDFWATWCGPCLAAMPHVHKVAVQYAGQDVVVIGSCTSDGRADFVRWVKANREMYPNIRFGHDAAEENPGRASRKLYGVSGIPHQFVIDRAGKVVASVSGYMEGEVLLDAALAKAGVTVAPEVREQAARDQQKRDERQRKAPAVVAPLPIR